MVQQIETRHFGTTTEGHAVDSIILNGGGGLSLQAITFGGIVTHLRVPDRRGELADVVLGFNNLAGYLAKHPYFGAITGRVAGRISGARFALDGKEFPLAVNDPPNHLHGGLLGFDKRIWQAEVVTRADGAPSVRFSRISPDGEEGYPGSVRVAVTYTITPKNEFVIDSEATTDRASPISLTHHSYFNLAGEGSGSIEQHELQIFSSTYAPSDSHGGLFGRRVAVDENNFRTPKAVGEVIPHIRGQHGDNYFIDRAGPAVLVDAARLVDPQSGRVMTVRTTDECLQFYSGLFLDGSLIGKSGRPYNKHGGLCLECQGYPDGVNRPELGNIILRPGEVYRHTTVYAFSTL